MQGQELNLRRELQVLTRPGIAGNWYAVLCWCQCHVYVLYLHIPALTFISSVPETHRSASCWFWSGWASATGELSGRSKTFVRFPHIVRIICTAGADDGLVSACIRDTVTAGIKWLWLSGERPVLVSFRRLGAMQVALKHRRWPHRSISVPLISVRGRCRAGRIGAGKRW